MRSLCIRPTKDKRREHCLLSLDTLYLRDPQGGDETLRRTQTRIFHLFVFGAWPTHRPERKCTMTYFVPYVKKFLQRVHRARRSACRSWCRRHEPDEHSKYAHRRDWRR